jgi:threonine dehydrogenase-like Zn-dependent dehydrogenase
MGHEYCGEVVELGSSFRYTNEPGAAPESHAERTEVQLYQELRIGDVVIGAFTVTCNECGYVRQPRASTFLSRD